MSYDLHAVRVPPGRTVEEALDAADRDRDTPPTAEERRGMERLADALLAVDPAAERHDGERFIGLNAPTMQVTIQARSADITVPFWHDQPADADRVMTRAYEYAAVLAEVAGYTVYDAQTEDIVAGMPPERFARIMAETTRALAEEPEPRWKFWKRR